MQELHDGRGGKDPFPLLLKKTKLPKKWKEKPGKIFYFKKLMIYEYKIYRSSVIIFFSKDGR